MEKVKFMKFSDFERRFSKTWLNALNEKIDKTEKTEIKSNEKLFIGDKFVPLNEIPKLLGSLNLGIQITTGMPHELLQGLFEYLLEKDVFSTVAVVDKEIISFSATRIPYNLNKLSEVLKDINNSDIIAAISMVDDDQANIFSIDRVLKTHPRKGDDVCGGLALNVLKEGVIRAFPFSFRMWCSNGAVHMVPKKLKTWEMKFHSNSESNGFFDIIQKEYNEAVGETLNHIRNLTNTRIESNDIGKFLRITMPTHPRLSPGEINTISSDIRGQNHYNAYDLWNIMTQRLSERALKNPSRAFRYLRIGGNISDVLGDLGNKVEQKMKCNECGTVIGKIKRDF